jgi:predicted nucleotidyltransferase
MISSKNNLAHDTARPYFARPCAHTAVLKTLCYADIFDYPLTKKELFKYLIANEKISKKDMFRLLDMYIPGVGKLDSYYFLSGKKNLVAERKKRGIESKKKMEKARRIAGLISFLPGVKFIGLSGSLAMNNCRKNDDIDLFVITSKRRLWTSRLLALALLTFLGEKREKNNALGRDKICLNMFLSEDSIMISKNLRNLFAAHEVVQVKPLFNKDDTYEKFLYANKWVSSFLPNAIRSPRIVFSDAQRKLSFTNLLCDALEIVFFGLQYLYMRSNITSEVVNKSVARFHPKDIKRYVLSLYKLKCKVIFEANFTKKTRFYSRLLT